MPVRGIGSILFLHEFSAIAHIIHRVLRVRISCWKFPFSGGCLKTMSRTILYFCVLFISLTTFAAPGPDPVDRPRIGLVLSGGGARGAAHIGVLKVLEEMHIPIDAIAGTSVGALVGGLYASGMSPDEIQHIVQDTDWDKVFDDAPSRNNLSFRRKMDNGKYIPNLEVGIQGGRLMMPTGLTVGRKVSFMLHRILLRNGFIQDFDELHIPFRAVATDLTTGEMVVLSKGNLADALRASMAVPGAISPLDLNGRLLADGGLVRNLPIDVIQKMDVDIVIAVNVAKGLFPRKRLNSALAVSQQMITIMLLKDEHEQLSLLHDRDVYIHPELGDMAASDFANMGDVIEPAFEATRAQADKLKSLSVDEETYAAYLAHQRGADVQEQQVDFVNVSDQSRLDPQVLLSRIKTETGKKLDLATLQRDLGRIYQVGSFETVTFEWVEDEDRQGILIHTKAKPWGNNFLQLGVKLSDNLEGDSRFDLLMAHTMTEVNRLGGEWKNEFQFGSTRRIRTEFFQPLDYAGHWAIMPYLEYSSDVQESYDSELDNWTEYRLRLLSGGFLAGRQFGNWGAAMVGFVRRTGSLAPFTVFQDNLTGPSQDVDMGGYTVRLDYDQTDDPYFPRSGDSGHLHWYRSTTSLGADRAYHKLDFAYEAVFDLGESTLVFGGEYGDSLGSELPYYDNFRLGGRLRLSGYRLGQISGNQKAFLRSVYYRQLPIHLFGFKFFAGGSVEAGNVWKTRSQMNWNDVRLSGSMFMGSRTMAGAIYVGIGFSEEGDTLFYFTLGQIF